MEEIESVKIATLKRKSDKYELYYCDVLTATTDLKNLKKDNGILHKLNIDKCNLIFGIVDIERLALNEYRDFPDRPKESLWEFNKDTNAPRKRKAFIKGYQRALLDRMAYQFTIDDLIRVELCYLRECDLDIRYKGQIVTRINNERMEIPKEIEVSIEIGFESKMIDNESYLKPFSKTDDEGFLIINKR